MAEKSRRRNLGGKDPAGGKSQEVKLGGSAEEQSGEKLEGEAER